MIEDFVSFDLAKKLKEKGYPQEPDIYGRTAYYEYCGLRKVVSSCNDAVWHLPEMSRDNIFASPTISQVLKWLREEKKRHLLISTYHHTPFNVHDWGYDIINLKTYDVEHYDYGYNSYEASALAGIKYCLDNLI